MWGCELLLIGNAARLENPRKEALNCGMSLAHSFGGTEVIIHK